MNKQPEDWLDDVPENENEDDDEIIWVSKSEIKRDAEALKDLGAEMVDLGKNALDRIPLDEDLRAAIELAQKIKKEGRRRQLQLIGKMLRARDIEPIQTALDKLKTATTSRFLCSINWKRCATAWWKKAMTSFRLSWICIRPPIANSCVHWCATRRKRRPPTSRLRLTARSSNTCASWPKRPTKRRRHPGMKPFHPR